MQHALIIIDFGKHGSKIVSIIETSRDASIDKRLFFQLWSFKCTSPWSDGLGSGHSRIGQDDFGRTNTTKVKSEGREKFIERIELTRIRVLYRLLETRKHVYDLITRGVEPTVIMKVRWRWNHCGKVLIAYTIWIEPLVSIDEKDG